MADYLGAYLAILPWVLKVVLADDDDDDDDDDNGYEYYSPTQQPTTSPTRLLANGTFGPTPSQEAVTIGPTQPNQMISSATLPYAIVGSVGLVVLGGLFVLMRKRSNEKAAALSRLSKFNSITSAESVSRTSSHGSFPVAMQPVQNVAPMQVQPPNQGSKNRPPQKAVEQVARAQIISPHSIQHGSTQNQSYQSNAPAQATTTGDWKPNSLPNQRQVAPGNSVANRTSKWSERLDNLRRNPVVRSRKSEEIGREALRSLQQWESTALPRSSAKTMHGLASFRRIRMAARKQRDTSDYHPKRSLGERSEVAVQESHLASTRSSAYRWLAPVRAWSGASSVKEPFGASQRISDVSGQSTDDDDAIGDQLPQHQRGLAALLVVADKLREDFAGRMESRSIAELQESVDETTTARDFLLMLQDIVGTHNVATTVEFARTRVSFQKLLVSAQKKLLRGSDDEL